MEGYVMIKKTVEAEKITYLVNPLGNKEERKKYPSFYKYPRFTDNFYEDWLINTCIEDINCGKIGRVDNFKQLDLVIQILAELHETPDNEEISLEKVRDILDAEDVDDNYHCLEHSEYQIDVECWKLNNRFYIIPKSSGLSCDDIKKFYKI